MRMNPQAAGLAATMILALGGSALAAGIKAPDVPPALRVPSGQVAFLVARGDGVQIYECAASSSSPGAYEWTFRAPDAVLKDEGGRTLGHHFAGPTWEYKDGSSVVGDVQAHAPAAAASAIPWLLLTARTTAGSGLLTGTTSIQRLDTVGGIAPSVGCDATSVGKEARVPYTATYYFYHLPK